MNESGSFFGWLVGWNLWSAECGVRSAECGVQSVKNEEYGK